MSERSRGVSRVVHLFVDATSGAGPRAFAMGCRGVWQAQGVDVVALLGALGVSRDEISGRVARVTVEIGERSLPPGWELRPGLMDRVWVRLPRRSLGRLRRRLADAGAWHGSVHETSDGRYAVEVKAERVEAALPDRIGEGRHRAEDEAAGHDPAVVRR